ncbi:hypothetical protein JTB14_031324 [Gonioctena quinquepunctata]|nr:hypothetical protein JTB14_031324 [Gonioctena quinquepunctata]
MNQEIIHHYDFGQVGWCFKNNKRKSARFASRRVAKKIKTTFIITSLTSTNSIPADSFSKFVSPIGVLKIS